MTDNSEAAGCAILVAVFFTGFAIGVVLARILFGW